MNRRMIGLFGMVLGISSAALASDGAAAFEKLKVLAGTWKGTAHVSGQNMPMSVTYRVTSGGHAIEEKIAPNTDHEMVTMYFLEGGSLVLTHYCTMGNQPHMKLTQAGDANNFKFDFAGGSNIKAGDGHMHSASMKFVSANKIQTKWYAMMGGKEMFHIEMDLERAK